jgi:hypothetical protein
VVAVILDFRLQKNNKQTKQNKTKYTKENHTKKPINNTDYDQTV